MTEETNDLTLDEASEVILETLMAPEEEPTPEPEPEPTPEPEVQPEQPDYIQQAQSLQPQLAVYQQELTNEAATIREMERDARSYRKDNPGEYAARMADIQLRTNKLTQAAQQFQSHVNTFESQVAKRATADHERTLAQEQAKLEAEIPDWGPETKLALTKYLRGKGYSDSQLAQIQDAETVKIALRSMQNEQSKVKKTLPKKTDKRAQIERDIVRRHLGHNSIDAAAERIRGLMR